MLSTPDRRPWAGAALVVAAVVVLTGCSPGGGDKPSSEALDAPAGQPAEEPGGGPIGLSPGGVTTRIDIPAQSTEEQYAQACMATKAWMDAQGGDPDTLVEPYLKQAQAWTAPSPVTFNKTWAELADPQRAAVIIAVRAAADGGC